MAPKQIYKQLSPYKFFKIEVATQTGTAFQRIKGVKGVKLEKKICNDATILNHNLKKTQLRNSK